MILLIKGNKKVNNQIAKPKYPIFSKQNCQRDEPHSKIMLKMQNTFSYTYFTKMNPDGFGKIFLKENMLMIQECVSWLHWWQGRNTE